MKKYKIIIYSKKKIFIQLLYAYIREYIERKNKEREYSMEIMIEGRTFMEITDAELYRDNVILLFDCSDIEDVDNFKKILSKEIEDCKDAGEYGKAGKSEISSNKKESYIILLDSIYCKIEEKVLFQEQDRLYLVHALEELIETIERIVYTDDNSKKTSNNLTRREKEILILITKGKLNKEIANELNITERTVKNHIANLFKKINVYDRTQAAVYAIKNGIYSLYLEDL